MTFTLTTHELAQTWFKQIQGPGVVYGNVGDDVVIVTPTPVPALGGEIITSLPDDFIKTLILPDEYSEAEYFDKIFG